MRSQRSWWWGVGLLIGLGVVLNLWAWRDLARARRTYQRAGADAAVVEHMAEALRKVTERSTRPPASRIVRSAEDFQTRLRSAYRALPHATLAMQGDTSQQMTGQRTLRCVISVEGASLPALLGAVSNACGVDPAFYVDALDLWVMEQGASPSAGDAQSSFAARIVFACVIDPSGVGEGGGRVAK